MSPSHDLVGEPGSPQRILILSLIARFLRYDPAALGYSADRGSGRLLLKYRSSAECDTQATRPARLALVALNAPDAGIPTRRASGSTAMTGYNSGFTATCLPCRLPAEKVPGKCRGLLAHLKRPTRRLESGALFNAVVVSQ
jgi:hypothetical protein